MDALNIIDRDGWGARLARPGILMRHLIDLTTWIGHYADAPARDDLEHEEAACRAIQTFHMDTRGWLDVGYHWMIGNSGNVYAGRRPDQVGAHCQDFNTPTLGVCFLTDDGISPLAGAAFVALVQTVEYVALHRQLRLDRHNEHVETGCPGPKVGPWFDRVRFVGGPLARPR